MSMYQVGSTDQLMQQTYKPKFFLVSSIAVLALGTMACANEQSRQEATVKSDTEPGSAQARVRGEKSMRDGAASAELQPSAADWETTLKVKLALLEKLGVDSLRVDVTSQDGQVALVGTVDKRETKELAETIAESVPSVTKVRNDIRLASNQNTGNKVGVVADEAGVELKDAMLSTKVRLALLDVLGSGGFRIGTEVASGVVTLEFAPELAKARRAEALKAAQGVSGVTKVVSVDKT